ncbi:ABC transporter ATP-binding protein [Lacrimispora sp. 210928-DFI.3.58]|uniref:ABC transporter ATP-binding protein n=1 Tax=Lacrimispora sp. 210928-DFI.3.58 TaxID=2883214 RepID=UPI0015B3A258|nr:ABC transporter ATP-binding protein [Lacrimispora sp. 210928-DFI.3.58]MCB7319448.1 ABC transporter ATP-binding protein [Lacrimispora sp. 210928-DFI.3.58]
MIPKLECNRVSYSYHSLDGETLALSDISFSVASGEFIAIVGPSGCGKSTLLSLLSGLTEPEQGEILIDGKPLKDSPSATGYMLQKDHLFEWRTIFSNVALGLEIQKRLDGQTKEELLEMLDSYGLTGFEHAKPSELSGGMRQRAALIRTLALKPDLLLLDEPFSALDYQTRLTVCDDIGSILQKTGKTAILVTHDLSEAISVADRIIILTPRPGRIKSILPITFPADCKSPLARRNCPEFSNYFNSVWKELKVYG